MTDKAKKLEGVKQEIRSVLLTQPNGLTVAALLSDYRNMVGFSLPFREFGFCGIDDFLKSIPDVVSVRWSSRYNTYMLKAVADETTKHIEKLVSKQKTSKSATKFVAKSAAASRRIFTAAPPRFNRSNTTRNYTRACLPPSVKNEICEVSKEYKNGLSLPNFLTAFRRRYGKELTFGNYGFYTLEDCLVSIPELFVRHEDEEIRVYPIIEKQKEARPTIYSDTWRQDPIVHSNYHNEKENCPVSNKEQHPVNAVVKVDNAPAVTSGNMQKESKTMDALDDFSYQDELPANNFGITPALREQFKQIMKKNPQGIWVSQFPEVLKKYSGYRLDHRELGYFNLVDLFNDLPEIFRIEVYQDCKDDWMLFDATSTAENLKSKEDPDVRPPSDTKVHTVFEILKNIRLLLQANCEGVSFENFSSLYEANCGEQFNLIDLGFDSFPLFLNTIADQVPLKIDYSGKTPRVFYRKEEISEAVTNSASPYLELPRDIPSDAVVGCTEYKSVAVLEIIDPKTFFAVCLTAAIDPSHIYIQLRREDTIIPLKNLMDDLDRFYYGKESENYRMPTHYIMSGVVCAAIWPSDGHWHRIRISNVPSNSTVVAFFVDFGSKEKIASDNLRFLKKKFMELPAQAIRSHLYNVQPYSGTSWDPRAKDRILNSFSTVPLMAYLTSKSTEEESLPLVLCDVRGEIDVFLNDLLVSEGLAKYSTSAHAGINCEEPSGRDSHIEAKEFIARNRDQEQQVSSVQQQGMSTSYAPSMRSRDLREPGNVPVSNLFNNLSNTDHAALHPLVLKQLQALEMNNANRAATFSPAVITANNAGSNFSSSTIREHGQSPFVNLQQTSHDSDSEFFESDEEVDDDDNPEVNSISKRYVRRINLDDGYDHVHMIVIDSKPYMSSGDITFLLWNHDDPDYVRRKLKSKEIYIPNTTMNEVGYEQLFYQLGRFQVKGIKTNANGNSYITLFYFKNVIDILNIFGHPSIAVRDIIENEQLQFEPTASFWKTIPEEEFEENSAGAVISDDKEHKSNLYELKASLQALKFRKQALRNQLYSSAGISGLGEEIEMLERQCSEVEQQIRDLQVKMVSRHRDSGFD